MYFYATREDKSGNTLTTSYGNKMQAKKYGGYSAKLWDGIRYLDRKTGKMNTTGDGDVVRSKIVSTGSTSMGGKFALFTENDYEIVDLGLRFPSYGAANASMKAMAGIYTTLYLLELSGYEDEDEVEVGSPSNDEPSF